MPPNPPKGALRFFLQVPVFLYRWNLGGLLGRRFLLLIHIGRRTGIRRQTVLEVLEYRDDGPEFIVMSGFGRNADWLRNIEARRTAEIIVGSQRLTVAHRFLSEEEAIEALHHYEYRNRFMASVIRCVLSRLAGWRYRSSETDRRRLVQQLPLLAFRPLS
jgi:deazaflavin-dependent oxidoreductase (nitroreductase family)